MNLSLFYNFCAGISIAASLAVLVTLYAFKNLRSKSSKFIIALAISDILICSISYMSYLPNRDTNISLCRFQAWWIITMTLAQAFVSVLVVDHLSRILRLQDSHLRNASHFWLIFLALYVFTGIFTLIPLFTDDYGMHEGGYCWIPADSTFRVYFAFMLENGIVLICLIYSTIQMARVIHYYNTKVKKINKKPLAFENIHLVTFK